MAETSQSHLPTLKGLVLLGGFSRRMGADKAQLSYHGQPQAQWAYEALQAVCGEVFLSARDDQDLTGLNGLPLIRDRYHNLGPAAGLLSAADTDSQAAWLLLACDMPLVNRDTLSALVTARDGEATAVAYRHPDGVPEPLCAIYEPAACPVLRARIDGGEGASLRAALLALHTRWLQPPDPDVLRNANDPGERDALQAALKPVRPSREQ